MPQPPGYNRQYNLTEYATANPSAPYNAAQHDAEFNAIEATLDQTLVNLTYIQRDDGPLKNGVVTTDSLSSAVAALLATGEGELRGAWLTATAYAVRDVVTNSGSTYICVTAHTSGVFATDLAAGKWIAIDTGNSITAAGVSFSPTGSVAATTVQAAIAEVDSEKLAKASNLSDVASRVTAFNNLVAGGGTMTGGLTFSGARVNEAKGADVASSATIDLDGATGNLVDVTGTTAITAITLSAGRESVVRFTGVLTLTNGANLVLPGGSNITTAAGDFAVFRGYASGVVRCVSYSKATGLPVVSPSVTIPQDYISGFQMSSPGGSATMAIAAGTASDSGNSVLIAMASALSKTTSAWAAGSLSGGLDTGAIANNTWYHFFAIRCPDTGVVDVLFSTSASAPTMPANYTQKRRIGSGLTDGAGKWTAFVQVGNYFYWLALANDSAAFAALSTVAANYTCTVPTGVQVLAMLQVYLMRNSTAIGARVFNPSLSDAALDSTANAIGNIGITATGTGSVRPTHSLTVLTNTSAQVRAVTDLAPTAVDVRTAGWIDFRGMN